MIGAGRIPLGKEGSTPRGLGPVERCVLCLHVTVPDPLSAARDTLTGSSDE